MRVHSFDTDIRGDEYESFIDTMLLTQTQFSLVWRDRLSFSERASQVRRELAPLEAEVTRTRRWPGTVLMKKGTSMATVVRYKCAASARAVLLRPRSLFSWLSPHFPEDLAFYEPDGSCSLASVAHEKDAYVLTPAMVAHVEPFVTLDPMDVSEESLCIMQGKFWS
jgi:hypothetical protein